MASERVTRLSLETVTLAVKPVRITSFVTGITRTFWNCHRGHHHGSRDIAASCAFQAHLRELHERLKRTVEVDRTVLQLEPRITVQVDQAIYEEEAYFAAAS